MSKRKKPKRVKITATVYDRRGKILSVGENSYVKTHPKMFDLAKKTNLLDKTNSYLHAEVAALVKVKKGIPYKIFIERYGKDGRELCAKPCPMCELAIKESGIKRVEYTVGK